MKPTQNLARICKDESLDGPHYTAPGKCRVENMIFAASPAIIDEAGTLCIFLSYVFLYVLIFYQCGLLIVFFLKVEFVVFLCRRYYLFKLDLSRFPVVLPTMNSFLQFSLFPLWIVM